MEYKYNIDKKLVTSFIPLKGKESFLVSMTKEEAKYCIGFDDNGNRLYDQEKLDKFNLIEKQKQIDVINSKFNDDSSKVGIELIGNFVTLEKESVTNPKFQYDDLSQNRLLKFKDITEVNFWRSVDNKNVCLTNDQKNILYYLLLTTWANKFSEKSLLIDSL